MRTILEALIERNPQDEEIYRYRMWQWEMASLLAARANLATFGERYGIRQYKGSHLKFKRLKDGSIVV